MNTRLLEDKVVIVTGGSRGIGRAIVVECARHGANVLVNYWGENDASYGRASAAEELAAEIATLGQRAVFVEGDVGDAATGQILVDAAVKAFGKVDVLSSNAGICPFHAFLDIPAAM